MSDYVEMSDIIFVVKIAACGAQQEHLGQKMSLVLMVVKLAAGEVVP